MTLVQGHEMVEVLNINTPWEVVKEHPLLDGLTEKELEVMRESYERLQQTELNHEDEELPWFPFSFITTTERT